MFMDIYEGYENDCLVLNLNKEKLFIKLFSPNRYQYDGMQLYNKYNFLHNSCFKHLDIIECNKLKNTRNSLFLVYKWIPGRTKYYFSFNDLRCISKKLCEIHSYEIHNISNYDFFNDYYIKKIFDECNINFPKTNDNKCFIHGDFHPGNIVWVDENINGIIDWDNCCIGYRQLDIANIRFDISLYNNIDMAEYFLDSYEKCFGTVIYDMTKWDYCVINIQENKYLRWSNYNIKNGLISEKIIKNNFNNWKKYIKQKL